MECTNVENLFLHLYCNEIILSLSCDQLETMPLIFLLLKRVDKNLKFSLNS